LKIQNSGTLRGLVFVPGLSLRKLSFEDWQYMSLEKLLEGVGILRWDKTAMSQKIVKLFIGEPVKTRIPEHRKD